MAQLWPDFREQAIVYEDDDLIVVDKPAGVPAQAAEASHDDDLVARLRRFLGARRGVPAGDVYLGVHQRLDRDTSGLTLFTLRPEVNAAIAAQFAGRSVQKRYVAAVIGSDARAERERVLEHHLLRGRDGRMQVIDAAGAARAREAKRARTRVKLRRRVADRALLELGCDTGRTHQLRVQLAHVGTPISGDSLYGGAPAFRLLLHAEGLSLAHPRDGRAMSWSAPLPLEFGDWLEHGARDVAGDPVLLRRALALAMEARYRLGRARDAERPTTAFRLFERDADGAADLAVDVYGEHLVAHAFGGAVEAHEEDVLDALHALGFAGVYLKRHLKQKNELVEPRDPRYAPADPLRGEAVADEIVIHEYGVPFAVRLHDGLRTGLFLDQRENRKRVHDLSEDKRVLNLFAYTSGFAVAALAGGAREVVCVDASAGALAWGRRNVERIGAQARHRAWHGDVFDVLAQLRRKRTQFDLIIVDPPSYSNARGERFVATKDYATLCQACLHVLAPEGQLLACINHHGVSRGKLRRDVRSAAEALGRPRVQLKDLPTQLDFPSVPGAEPHTKSLLASFEA